MPRRGSQSKKKKREFTLDDVMAAMNKFATHVDERFDRLEARMSSLEERVTFLEERMSDIERRMEDGFTTVNVRLKRIEEDINTLRIKIENLAKRTLEDSDAQGKDVVLLIKRVDILERKVGLLQEKQRA